MFFNLRIQDNSDEFDNDANHLSGKQLLADAEIRIMVMVLLLILLMIKHMNHVVKVRGETTTLSQTRWAIIPKEIM